MPSGKVLVTGASGNAGRAVSALLAREGYTVRRADVAPPAHDDLREVEFVRCDTRTPDDARRAVEGVDAVVHLAAWHCAHVPPVSDATIFSVNVDGTFNVLEACRNAGVKAIVYASSMAYGWGGVYGVTKVIGEDLCRCCHEMTGAAIAMLRYHDFVPKPYLDHGVKLLRNGVDRADVASATVAALRAAMERRIGLFRTIVHTDHHMPQEVVSSFRQLGPNWLEEQLPGAKELIRKYAMDLPETVEQHDLSEAETVLGWTPKVGFLEFLKDLQRRDARGEDVRSIWTSGELPLEAS
ncbi:MAG TPA: NAD(P)-dependent oxidoreductase [Armatimonadota bacterium]|jgi:nucleoside-diphosphate-sugar epimerase